MAWHRIDKSSDAALASVRKMESQAKLDKALADLAALLANPG